MKFLRNYELDIELDPQTGQSVRVNYPLTVNFSIIKHTLASANTATFTILNLKETTRRQIYQDRFDIKTYRRIRFSAGYGTDLSVIFEGNIRIAQSYRNGVNWETRIDAFDGGYGMINGFSTLTFSSGERLENIIRTLAQDLPNIETENVSSFPLTIKRGRVFSGNTYNLLKGVLDLDTHEIFVENEKLNIIGKNQYIEDGGIRLISAETGLTDTPVRRDARIELSLVFEPKVKVGQIVEVESRETINNGLYKIVGVSHSGIISESVSGDCKTNLSLYIGEEILTKI